MVGTTMPAASTGMVSACLCTAQESRRRLNSTSWCPRRRAEGGPAGSGVDDHQSCDANGRGRREKRCHSQALTPLADAAGKARSRVPAPIRARNAAARTVQGRLRRAFKESACTRGPAPRRTEAPPRGLVGSRVGRQSDSTQAADRACATRRRRTGAALASRGSGCARRKLSDCPPAQRITIS